MNAEQPSEATPPAAETKRLPPGRLDIVYRFGFIPFWRRKPEDWVIEPENTRRWQRLSKLSQSGRSPDSPTGT